MRITDITKQKRRPRVNVFVDGRCALLEPDLARPPAPGDEVTASV
jgi:hypothetical protein